jgi:lipoate-protein ligase A
MAVDTVLLETVASSESPPTLRIYGWSETAITVGRFQDVEKSVNVPACTAAGIPIIRRPTGGRGILHGGDVTVSLAISEALLGSDGGSIAASYRRLSQGFIAALDLLNIGLAMGNCERLPGRGGDCFASKSQADMVTAGGEKLIGSAQRRSAGVILQQSSLRYRPARVLAEEVFLGLTAAPVYPLADIGLNSVQEALIKGFQQALKLPAEIIELTNFERERAAILVESTYRPLLELLVC